MTAMATVDGHLVIAAGNRVETHAWNGGRLQRTAFYDAQVVPGRRGQRHEASYADATVSFCVAHTLCSLPAV